LPSPKKEILPSSSSRMMSRYPSSQVKRASMRQVAELCPDVAREIDSHEHSFR
jgi:hypothetical protein